MSPLRLEQVLELEAVVEVVLDGALLAAGHDDDLLDAGRDGLLDRVLDDRLVDERQHLLRLRLGGWQEPRPPAGSREDGLANAQDRTSWSGSAISKERDGRAARSERPSGV